MKYLPILAIISLLILTVVLGGCANDSKLAKLEQDISDEKIDIGQDIGDEEIDIGQDIQDVEKTFDTTEEVISDDELNDFLADVEGSDDTSDFDLENDMDFNLNLD